MPNWLMNHDILHHAHKALYTEVEAFRLRLATCRTVKPIQSKSSHDCLEPDKGHVVAI